MKKFNVGIDAIQTLQLLEVRTNPTSNRKIPVKDLETLHEKCYREIVSISVPNSTRFRGCTLKGFFDGGGCGDLL